MISGTRSDVWRLAAASAASSIGNWAATIALSLTVYARTGSTVWLAAAFLFTQVPSALAAPVSGTMADKLNRQRIMITCDLLGAATYAGMAVTGSPLVLITLGSLAALLHSPFGPAARAALPNLAGEADLAWANGTLAAASNVGQLAGPALGGVLYAFAGAGPAFGVNAVSFVVSAGLIAVVRGRFRSEVPEPAASAAGTGSVWAGVRFLRHNTTLLVLTVVGAVTFMATEVAAVADLPLIHHFGVGGVGYGIMNVAWGAGGLIGALIAARVVSKDSETAAAVLGVLAFGVFVAAVGLSPWFVLIPLFSLLFAGSDSFAFVGFNGIYQRGTPDAIRGRMFAAVGAITTFASAASYGFGGFVVAAVGWRPVYLGGGLVDVACAGVLALVCWLRPSRDRALGALGPPQ
ncbi:MAG TPA: MFS transporter [Streptosporangiaceae bacterium]|jgi:MFS family permease